MSDKFYRVKKDTPLWLEGAIIKHSDRLGSKGGYSAIDDIWDATEEVGEEYLSAPIVEKQPEFFERVYSTTSLGLTVYVLKEKARELFAKTHRE